MNWIETVWTWGLCIVALIGCVCCIVAPFALRWYNRELRKGGKS